jgi:hypothetical protein
MQPISRNNECQLFNEIFKEKKIQKKALSIERISSGPKPKDPFEDRNFNVWIIKNGKLLRRNRKSNG